MRKAQDIDIPRYKRQFMRKAAKTLVQHQIYPDTATAYNVLVQMYRDRVKEISVSKGDK